jgi:hypothetical protein
MEGAMAWRCERIGRIARWTDCRTPEELAMVMKIVEPPDLPDPRRRERYTARELAAILADRADMLAQLPGLVRAAKQRQKDRDRGQNNLFDG